MSNTWEYRFAFRIEGAADVPPEFERSYEALCGPEGNPLFGLFTPAMERSRIIKTCTLNPRLILVFQYSLAVIWLEDRSGRVSILKRRRDEILGCALGSFLLNCWLAVYPGRSPGERLEIQFPPQAFQHHEKLFSTLLTWCGETAEVSPSHHNPERRSVIPGLPPKFSAFLEKYPEPGPPSDFLFQPAAQLHKESSARWANLLLIVNRRGITALSDLQHNCCSEYGVEMSFFPLRSVEKTEWVEPVSGSSARITINFRAANVNTSLSWSVFSGLRPYGIRWIQAVNSEMNNADYRTASSPAGQVSVAL